VLRYEGQSEWSDQGQLGIEVDKVQINEVNDLTVFNGKLYAGVIPKGEVYRYEIGLGPVGVRVHAPQRASTADVHLPLLGRKTDLLQQFRAEELAHMAAGVALMLVGVSKIYWASLAFMACLGFGIIVTAASVNMMLQTIVDEDKRGRIISFYAMAFLGMAPVGGLIAGSLAGELGAPVTAMIEGTCCLLGALALMRSLPAVRADLRRALAREKA
jgi:MFS family permease